MIRVIIVEKLHTHSEDADVKAVIDIAETPCGRERHVGIAPEGHARYVQRFAIYPKPNESPLSMAMQALIVMVGSRNVPEPSEPWCLPDGPGRELGDPIPMPTRSTPR